MTRVVVLGDSISGGLEAPEYAGFYYTMPWPITIAPLLGWEMHNLAVPGAGYVRGSGGPLSAQVPATLALAPDIVLIAGGVNDALVGGGNYTDVETAANSLLDSLASVPLIYVLSPMPGQSGLGDFGLYGNDARRQVGEAIRRAAAAHRRPYIDMLNPEWVYGTGKAAAPDGSGNADLYVLSDNIHLNQAGEDFIANRLAATIMAGYAANVIEAWVTTPAGAYVGHLDRSQASPFRRFSISRMRGADPGAGSFEYHLDNALLTSQSTLVDYGNLVWMRYRGRTLVWVIEERAVVLDEGEHATDWVRVTGRGIKQLLGDRVVWPTPFSEAALNPTAWGEDNQWRRFTNRAAGEMLWDLISESNARFATQLVRGTIETDGADGWTQDLRFDNLLDVVAAVTAAYGEVEFDGLTFNYRNAPGTDRSASVIFEEGADLLRVTRSVRDRDTLSWIVAEGVGEGVFAQLAVAKDVTVPRRREAYLDAKDAANLPLVQLRADAAISEHTVADSIALEVREDRYAVFDHFDLHDTVRVIAPSRGLDESAVIVAIYLAEGDDERVRVAIDVNSPRTERLLSLVKGTAAVRSSIGVRNRQPQGTLAPFSFSGADIFDSTDTMDVFLLVPDRMYVLIEARAMIRFREFFAPATAAASGGASTSGGAGGSYTTGTYTANHDHLMFDYEATASGGTTKRFGPGDGAATDVFIPTTDTADLRSGLGSNDHGHSMTQYDAHTHSTPAHTHALSYGVYKETYPASHSVTLKVYELVVGVWTLRTTIAGITADVSDQDLTAYITGPGSWRLELKSAAAQPNGGRLAADIAGYVLGAIRSA